MDWAQLRILDFEDFPLTTMLQFLLLAGYVPRLNSLTVSISAEKQHDMHERTRTIPIFEKFLCSTPALEELHLTWDLFPDCLPTIVELQGHSLGKLDLHYARSRDAWYQYWYIDILRKAPQLHHLRVRHLSLQGPIVDFQGTWYGPTINLSPSAKYAATEDVTVVMKVQSERKHAAMMERINNRRKAWVPAVGRTSEEIAQVIALATRNPRGE